MVALRPVSRLPDLFHTLCLLTCLDVDSQIHPEYRLSNSVWTSCMSAFIKEAEGLPEVYKKVRMVRGQEFLPTG